MNTKSERKADTKLYAHIQPTLAQSNTLSTTHFVAAIPSCFITKGEDVLFQVALDQMASARAFSICLILRSMNLSAMATLMPP
jgi:hypothetical protein